MSADRIAADRVVSRLKAKIAGDEELSDADLFDFLDAMTVGGIVARESTTGRGWRVHETSRAEGHNTVRAAIRNFLLATLNNPVRP